MRRRWFPFLGMVLLVSACTAAPASDATGVEIYSQLCARCHSDDLSGGIGPPLGPGSDAGGHPDDFLVRVIARGRGRMPSFDGTLSDEQIRRLVDFLRERQAG